MPLLHSTPHQFLDWLELMVLKARELSAASPNYFSPNSELAILHHLELRNILLAGLNATILIVKELETHL